MTKEEQRIEEVLAKIRTCVDKQRVQPGPKERRKNEEFLRNYCVKPPERYAILKELTVQNYCGEILERQKTEVNYDEILYVYFASNDEFYAYRNSLKGYQLLVAHLNINNIEYNISDETYFR